MPQETEPAPERQNVEQSSDRSEHEGSTALSDELTPGICSEIDVFVRQAFRDHPEQRINIIFQLETLARELNATLQVEVSEKSE